MRTSATRALFDDLLVLGKIVLEGQAFSNFSLCVGQAIMLCQIMPEAE